MKMISSTIIALSLAMSSPASGEIYEELIPDEWSILLGAHHVGADKGHFESFVPGVFLTWNEGPINTSAGIYSNSFGEPSVSVTFSHDHLSVNYAGFEAYPFGGLAYYGDRAKDQPIEIGDSGVIPIVGLHISHESTPLFVQLLPGDKELADYDYLITAGASFNF